MKRCPKCEKTYPDPYRFCQSDASELVAVAEAVALPPSQAGPAGDAAAGRPLDALR
jgi:hypothetical protein